MRRGLLITALMIIGLTGMANAQCAWVLWERVSPLVHREEGKWELQKAYPTYTDCMNAKEAEVHSTGEMFKGLGKNEQERTRVNPGENVIMWESKKSEFTIFEYKCLPDTIDPRK